MADLGNGRLDIVTVNYFTVSVLLGNGDGTFQSLPDFPGSYTSIAVGDFRRNGKLDLITTADNYVYVLLGNGDGTFAAHTDSPSVTRPTYRWSGTSTATASWTSW